MSRNPKINLNNKKSTSKTYISHFEIKLNLQFKLNFCKTLLKTELKKILGTKSVAFNLICFFVLGRQMIPGERADL